MTMKTAFITGASQGFGKALAEYFAAKKHRVAIGCNSNANAAEKIAAGIKKHGGNAITVGGDISNQKDVRRIFSTIREEFGKLDLLINNARFDPSDRKEETSDSDWWDMNLKVSLKGTFLCSLEALEIMKEQKNGCIINISSIRGIIPNNFNRIPYGAAKAGQISLTSSFALQAAKYNVRVNTFMPGVIETENLKKRISDARYREVISEIPLGRTGTMEEMCHAVMFLAENTYMTGTTLNCSGGLLIR